MVNLTDTQTRQITFREMILANFRYWQSWVNQNTDNPKSLDQALEKLTSLIYRNLLDQTNRLR